jgi:small subunit ribosomal protein S7
MPRRDLKAKDKKNAVTPADPVYKSVLVTKFINKLTLGGKKSLSERIVYEAMEKMKQKSGEDALAIFSRAIENVRPLLEVRARRVGGATYQVPSEVRSDRSVALAMRWVIGFSRQKTGKPIADRLAEELISASKKEGLSFKKREDTHKMADANKAFAHYRW